MKSNDMNDKINDDMDDVQGMNYLNLLNLYTIIYNKCLTNKTNLLESVNYRVPNNTSEIQETLNDLMNEHIKLEKDLEDPEAVTIILCDTVGNVDTDELHIPNKNPYYALTLNNKNICLSKSKVSLLSYGAHLMKSIDYEEANNFNIIKFI